MNRKRIDIKSIFQPTALPELVRYLLRDEAISGKFILGATLVALILANSPLQNVYDHVWHTNLSVGLGSWSLHMNLRHWINEGLMTFFFLVVGLEIKREIVKGELGKFRTALLPIAAAVGGMVVPALLYMAITAGSGGFRGWAIPMATDIAFAVGVLALLGNKVQSSLKLFLLTLAIVDDIGAIIVIAVFYGTGFNLLMLGAVFVLCLLLIAIRKTKLLSLPLFVVIGVGMWLAMNAAGIHASITGAVLGLLAPVYAFTTNKISLAERLEKLTIPFSTLIVVPLFAFANTGVVLSLQGFSGSASFVAAGVAVGLIVGKVLGITGASYLMIRFGFAKLPIQTTWTQMIGVGLLAGIGFTVSIFVTELAFGENSQLVDAAKLSIFGASAVSGLLGLYILRKTLTKTKRLLE